MTSPTKEIHQFYDFYRPTDATSYRFGKQFKGLGESHRVDRDDGKLLPGEITIKECQCYYLFDVYFIDISSRYVLLCVRRCHCFQFKLQTVLVATYSSYCGHTVREMGDQFNTIKHSLLTTQSLNCPYTI